MARKMNFCLKGDLEAIWEEKAEPRNNNTQYVPSGLLGISEKVLAAEDCRGGL